MRPYKILIGLETHVQLLTNSKLFCGCATQFGAPPNTQTCPVCLGLPGALPVLNRKAFQLALKAACALNCQISSVTRWDRKNYYYPDLPKGFQTSQYDMPVGLDGGLTISHDPKHQNEQHRIDLIRVHLEEDAGKSVHENNHNAINNRSEKNQPARIDLNRAGTPLLEIVTRPVIRSPEEAYLYLKELKLLLEYLNVSDCNMQEGSLRCDANINLQIFSTPENQLRETFVTPIVEIKNLNSFRAVRAALTFEVRRQYESFLKTSYHVCCDKGKQTRLWDEQSQTTKPMRSKEETSDYRYFPEPDLLQVSVRPDEIAAIRECIGEKPSEIKRRLTEQYQISDGDANIIVCAGGSMVRYFSTLADLTGDTKQSANWLMQEVMPLLKAGAIHIESFPIPAVALAELLKKINIGELPRSLGTIVFSEMLKSHDSVDQIMVKRNINVVSLDEMKRIVDQILDENGSIVDDILHGKTKAISALIGKAKKLNRNVVPEQIERILKEKIQTSIIS